MRGFIVIICVLWLVGCGSVGEVLVPRVRLEYKERLRVDSVVVRDSVLRTVRGDTVYLNRYRDRYHYRLLRDTVDRIDTVTLVRRVEVPVVTNRLNDFQRFSVWGFWLVLVVVFGYFVLRNR